MKNLYGMRQACRNLSGLVIAVFVAACGAVTTDVPGADNSSTVSGSLGSAATIPFAPTPDSDPFYAQPDPMPNVAPGTVLKSRSVTFSPGGVPQPNSAWQLQYASRDVNGKLQAVVATIVKPLIPSSTSPAPLVSYQFAEDSLGSKCAPSHTLTGGTDNGNAMGETLVYLPGLTTQGWTMVFPDYEGPYSEYGAGMQAGQATLDGIRAAENFEPAGLAGTATPVALWGYSGGALASAWASSLHPGYAPELNIVGVASGGTPADVFGVVKNAENGPFFNLIFSAIFGTNRAYPELIPDALLNDKGRAAGKSLKDACLGNPTDGSLPPMGKLADYTTAADPYATPGAVAVRPKVTLPQAGRVPTANMYLYHEQHDELIPIAGTDALVKTWCDAGAHINYFRDPVGGEHVAGVATGTPAALLYLISRFSGAATPTVPPGTQTCN